VKRRRAAAPYAKVLCALAKERDETELIGRELGTATEIAQRSRWRLARPLVNPWASAVARVARRLRSACSRRAVCLAVPLMLLLLLALATWGLTHHIYFDRRGVPDLEPFIRFELSTIGRVYDARGTVLVELAREYRQVVSYEEVPPVLRHAILAAEDKNFFTHSGVDYRALPRVFYKTAMSSVGAWWNGKGFRLRLPQGGSTLTQQLVRGYFLRDRWSRENDVTLFRDNPTWRLLSVVVGVPTTNKLFRKLEEVRLALWLEEEMSRRFGSRAQAKREIFARSASFNYLGNGRYGFATGSTYYFGKPLSSYTIEDAGKAALLAGITKAPRDYLPVPGDPRPLRRRNEILALMARNGYIPADLAKRSQAEPVLVAKAQNSLVKTQSPAAIDTVFDELRRHGAGGFGVEDLLQGRISVHATVDQRMQTIVNEALETGLALYEKRHPAAQGLVQGSVVVLRNSDAAILAEAGGRHFYKNRYARYSDFNRATGSLRQAGSAWKPMVYLAAFREGLKLDTTVPDEPIAVPMGTDRPVKWIANYDNEFKGPIPMRQALAESRNAVAVWITREIGLDRVIGTSRELGIHTPLQPYITTALGASEVRLLELAGAYRAMASGILAEPYIIDRVTGAAGAVLYEAARTALEFNSSHLNLIQEGLRGVVRIPEGTAHSLYGRDFPIPVMGKTGTTSDFRDALFVGSTYGPQGVTVAVRIGFDDNRPLGDKETGGRTALPIFREIMLQTYQQELVGSAPSFPRDIEDRIDQYLQRHPPDLRDPQLADHNRSLAARPQLQGEQSR
jgi:penicillin-binding protein 1A